MTENVFIIFVIETQFINLNFSPKQINTMKFGKFFPPILFIFFFLCSASTLTASQAPSNHPAIKVSEKNISAKKKARFQKKFDKIKAKLKKKGLLKETETASMDSEEYKRLAIIFLLSTLVLAVLSIFAGFLWFFAGLAALGAAIFLILWLVETV